MVRYISLILLIGLAWGQNTFYIELLNERDYPMFINKVGEYNIKAGKSMRILKMKGVTNSSKIERIDWKTKNSFYWSDRLRTDNYPVVSPSSYTRNGVGYSMVGLLPEMKGTMVTIYGIYQNQVDSVNIFIQ